MTPLNRYAGRRTPPVGPGPASALVGGRILGAAPAYARLWWCRQHRQHASPPPRAARRQKKSSFPPTPCQSRRTFGTMSVVHNRHSGRHGPSNDRLLSGHATTAQACVETSLQADLCALPLQPPGAEWRVAMLRVSAVSSACVAASDGNSGRQSFPPASTCTRQGARPWIVNHKVREGQCHGARSTAQGTGAGGVIRPVTSAGAWLDMRGRPKGGTAAAPDAAWRARQRGASPGSAYLPGR